MFLILFKLISFIPLFILRYISKLILLIVNITNAKPKRITRNNLKHIEGLRNVSLNESLKYTTESYLEYPFLWGNPDNYKKLLEIEDKPIFNHSAKPKLIFTLHMGCVDVMLFFVSDLLSKLNIIFTATKNKKINDLVKKIRESRGAKLYSASSIETNKFFKNFFKGEDIIIATDLVPHNAGKYSNFFGKECLSLDIIEKLSKKQTHDLYFVYLKKGTIKKYKLNTVHIKEPITTNRMNKYFEDAIKEDPNLYGWEYKKFRKLSGNRKNIY